GDEAIGGITPLIYSAALETPENTRFVKEYRAKFGKVPSYFSETSYTAGRWIHEAAKAIDGNVENNETFLAALRKVEIPDAPRGPIKLDAYDNPIQNVYIRKVEKKDGELWNTVIQTYPNVSQFWKYKPDDFLKQPVYDRHYPACKHCGDGDARRRRPEPRRPLEGVRRTPRGRRRQPGDRARGEA